MENANPKHVVSLGPVLHGPDLIWAIHLIDDDIGPLLEKAVSLFKKRALRETLSTVREVVTASMRLVVPLLGQGILQATGVLKGQSERASIRHTSWQYAEHNVDMWLKNQATLNGQIYSEIKVTPSFGISLQRAARACGITYVIYAARNGYFQTTSVNEGGGEREMLDPLWWEDQAEGIQAGTAALDGSDFVRSDGRRLREVEVHFGTPYEQGPDGWTHVARAAAPQRLGGVEPVESINPAAPSQQPGTVRSDASEVLAPDIRTATEMTDGLTERDPSMQVTIPAENDDGPVWKLFLDPTGREIDDREHLWEMHLLIKQGECRYRWNAAKAVVCRYLTGGYYDKRDTTRYTPDGLKKLIHNKKIRNKDTDELSWPMPESIVARLAGAYQKSLRGLEACDGAGPAVNPDVSSEANEH